MMFLIVGCGFLGSCVADVLANWLDRQVIATVRAEENAPSIDNIQCVRCDVDDIDDVRSINELCKDNCVDVLYLASMHQIDAVYKNPEQAMRINVDALNNFFKKVKQINRFIYASFFSVSPEFSLSAFASTLNIVIKKIFASSENLT